MFILDTISCGGVIEGMDPMIPRITSLVVSAIQIGIPVLLIIFGMMDLGKAVMAQKEDEIKKGQQMFLKRLLTAAIVFFVIMIVNLLFGILGVKDNITGCVDCFITGPSSPNCVTGGDAGPIGN